MPRSLVHPFRQRLLTQRQHAGRGHNTILAHHNCPVVQGCLVLEDGLQQIGGQVGVQPHSCADHIVELSGPFQDDQPTHAAAPNWW